MAPLVTKNTKSQNGGTEVETSTEVFLQVVFLYEQIEVTRKIQENEGGDYAQS